MSSVDLSKLIARKKFFIPAKRSVLHDLILEELEKEGSWRISVERVKSGSFSWNLPQTWAIHTMVESGEKVSTEIVHKLLAEFQKDRIKNRDWLMRTMVPNTPWELHYVVKEELPDGCICEVRSYPLLYARLVRKIDKKFDETDIQDARLQCEEHLVHVFIGGLGGKEIVDRKEVAIWQLLINDVNSRQIRDRIYQMLEQATGEVLLVGWIGTLLLDKLKELRSVGVDIKVVTHPSKAAKGQPWAQEIQRAYRELRKIIGPENISTKPEVHCRTVIVDNKAIIGSMDLNAYSLTGPHVEFAIYTEDVNTVRRMRSYFKNMSTPS